MAWRAVRVDAAGEAWPAALAEPPANARTLVIVGRAELAWDALFFKSLPAGSELLCRLLLVLQYGD